MIDKICNQIVPSNRRVIDKHETNATHHHLSSIMSTNNHSHTTININNLNHGNTSNNSIGNIHNNNNNIIDIDKNTSPPNKLVNSYPSGPGRRLSKDELYPPTPSIMVHNEKEVFSPKLQEFCLAYPIVVIRNICRVLNMNIGLFSTKTLVDADADHQIEVRTQLQQPSDQNWDPDKKKMIWRCESPRNFTKISRYASYQANTFQEYLCRNDLKCVNYNNHHCYENGTSPASKSSPNDHISMIYQNSSRDQSDSDSNCSIPGQTSGASSSASNQIFKKLKKNAQFNVVTFGTNVDLSDNKKWKAQLDELDKLPSFARVVSASNMLTHVGHSILGMNTVQLYMKVPGCRTPGHQENNNFCSVNINIGPGDCEWFGVPEEYWGPMAKLCAENNTNFVHGSWWPNLEDLYSLNIPVYRFIQKPGDLVWVNTGTVHWVQAIGWCNNIAWNVGPITTKQYRSAIERYEWNKLEKYKSIVPMIHLTWNLARNVEIQDEDLFHIIKTFMTKTLAYCERILGMLEKSDIDVKWHGKAEHEGAHYCADCELEVFNILFVKSIEKKHVVHCAKCAIEASSVLENFIVLQEYRMSYLKEVYTNFVKSLKPKRIKIPTQMSN